MPKLLDLLGVPFQTDLDIEKTTSFILRKKQIESTFCHGISSTSTLHVRMKFYHFVQVWVAAQANSRCHFVLKLTCPGQKQLLPLNYLHANCKRWVNNPWWIKHAGMNQCRSQHFSNMGVAAATPFLLIDDKTTGINFQGTLPKFNQCRDCSTFQYYIYIYMGVSKKLVTPNLKVVFLLSNKRTDSFSGVGLLVHLFLKQQPYFTKWPTWPTWVSIVFLGPGARHIASRRTPTMKYLRWFPRWIWPSFLF